MADEIITVSKRKYDRLLADSKELSALYEAGVDNWEGMEHVAWPDEEEDS